MDEIWKVGDKTYSVKPGQRDQFLNDFPGAALVKGADQDTSFTKMGFNQQNTQQGFNQQGFNQAGFGNQSQQGILTPGSGQVSKPSRSSTQSDLENWFDGTWLGSTVMSTEATGETADLVEEMFMDQSQLNMSTVTDFVDANIEVARNYVPSERMESFRETYVAEGKTWTAFARGVFENPLILPELLINSLGTQIGTLMDSEQAQIAAGSAFATGFASGGVNPYQRAGRGLYASMGALTASMESSLTFTELVRKELDLKGQEFTDENVFALLKGPKGIEIRNKAVGRGLAIGTVEAFTGFAAGKTVTSVLRTGPGMGKKILAAGSGIGVEAVGGGLGEVAGMTAAGQEYDVAEIGFEAITGTVTAPVNVGLAMLGYQKATYKLNKKEVSYSKMKDFISTATDLQIATANIQMINDQTGLKLKAYEKQTNAQLDNNIDVKVTDTKDRKKLVELQKERIKAERENQAKDTPSEVPGAEANLKRVDAEIKVLINKYSGAQGIGKTKQAKLVNKIVDENRLDQTIDFLETNKEFVGKRVVVAEDTNSTEKAYKKAAIEYNKKNKDSKQYDVNDKEVLKGDGFIVGDVIVINKEVARTTKGNYTVGSHELLHGIVAKHMKGLDASGKRKLGKSFMNVLTTSQQKSVRKRLKNQYKLEGDEIYNETGVQEMFTAFSDAIALNEITFDEGVFDKLKNVIQEILRVASGGLLVRDFSNGRQVYNFLKDYNKTVSEGGQISKRAKKLSGGGVDATESLESKSENKKKKAYAVGVVNKIENVLKERLKQKGKKYTQEEFRNSPEFSQIFDSIYEENGDVNNYIKSLGLTSEKFNETVKIASRRLMGYNPEAKRKTGSKEDITVGERIMSDIGYSKLDANKKLAIENKQENQTKRIDAAQRTKEGDTTFDIEDTSTDTNTKAFEEEDMSPAGQAKKKAEAIKAKEKKYSKFRRQIGIKTGTELYNKILDAARQSLLKAYERGTAVRNIQRKLRDQANSYLFKDIKNFLGTKTYVRNLKEYRTYIVDAIFTADFVQMEKMLPDNEKIFTIFKEELGTKAEVEAAVKANLLPKEALNVIDQGNTVRLYTKVTPSEAKFIKFFDQPAINPDTGQRSGLKGTRKDALAKAMGGALSLDATMQVSQDPEIAQKRQELAELRGESLAKDDIDQLASAIGRGKEVLFSNSPKVAAEMAVVIESTVQNINVLRKPKDGVYDFKDTDVRKPNKKQKFSKEDRQTIAEISYNIHNQNYFGEITVKKHLTKALELVVKSRKKGGTLKLGNAFEQLVIDQLVYAIKRVKSKVEVTKKSKKKNKGDLYLSFLKTQLGVEVKMNKARAASKTGRFKDGEFGFTQDNETINEETGRRFDDEIMDAMMVQVKRINELLGVDIAENDYVLSTEDMNKVMEQKYKFGIKGIMLTPKFLGYAYSNGLYKDSPQGFIQIGEKLYAMQTGNKTVDDLTAKVAEKLGIKTLELTDTGTIELVGSVGFDTNRGLKFRVYPKIQDTNFIDSDSNLLNKKFSESFVQAIESVITPESSNLVGDAVSKIQSISPDKPAKGITILDFDDTLATTKSKIIFTKPDGTKGKLNAEEYASTYQDLLGLNYKFDFSEFSQVIDGKTAPLFNKALKLQKKFGNEQMYVLTARPADSAPAIHAFLKANGLNIPLKNITGLANSTAESKAAWVAEKVGEGFNDFYFADDAIQNVKAVDNMLEQFDVKRKVQQAKVLFSKNMNKEFNMILENVTGMNSKSKISKVAAEKEGSKKGKFRLFVPPSHEDFVGLLYNFMGKGKEGNKHMAFFEKALIRPLNRAYRELNTMQQSIARDFKTLNKQFPDVKSKLNKKIEGLEFTYEDAVRVYLWSKHKHKIPGLSTKEINALSSVVKNDQELKAYANTLKTISKQKTYVAPGESWTAGDIRTDLDDATSKIGRAKVFAEFQKNVDVIFSEENLNKIEAAFGKSFKEALKDNLYRTKTGRNRPTGQNALVNRFTNYINGSVGAVMFINMRSAILQQMSIVNFLNFGDNNVFTAAARFADQPQYWSDWAMIFNSDMVKERRGGIKTDVNGAELAASLKGAKNTPRAIVAKLLELGFLPTQIGDNIAIATGGASFYRNRVNTYLKQGLSQKAAEKKAFTDFQAVTESTQQSARPDMVSQQQASSLGKIVLAFQNVTSQFNRIGKKAFLDIKNRRISPGSSSQIQSDVSNVSRITYYLAAQNLIFYSLQTALFAMMFDDEPDDEKILKKTKYMIHSSIDSVLRGSGVFGAVVSVLKNTVVKYNEQREKAYNPDESAVLGELLNIAVPVGIKSRKITNAEKTLNYNKSVIEEMETFDIDNPIWSARTSQIEAVTNVPVNRMYNKVRNVRDALNSDYTTLQRALLALGWSRYNLGIEDTKVEEVKENIKESKKREKKKTKKDNKKKTFKKKTFRKRGF